MTKLKIILSGGSGQVGRTFQAIAPDFPQFSLICPTHSEHDITDIDAIRQDVKKYRPDFYINAAAYTAVDKAEEEREKAYLVNETAVRNIATVCKENDIPLIHFSSDYVYHNDRNRPLLESDPTSPKGVYARSKLAGELAIQELLSSYLIFRISWVYSPYRNNFVKTMKRLLQDMETVKVVNDQIGAPCSASELAHDLFTILKRDAGSKQFIHRNSGIYNYTQLGTASWYDIVIEMKDILHLSTNVVAVKTQEFPRPAERPAYSLMDLTKVRKTFDLSLSHWKDALNACMKKMT